MLKLYLYGYFNRARSSRRLEAEATRNLELIWLLRGLRPGYKTIADFRRDNRGAFKAVFRAVVVLCRKLDLFGRELLAVKIAHVRERRQVQAAMLDDLTANGTSQISLTDPDARAMVTRQKTTAGYNAQVAVDAKYKLIVEQHVTNAATDVGLLASTADAAREALDVERIDAVADMGYYKGEDIEACEANGITPYVARPERGTAIDNGRFPKERFRYDPAAAAYHGPGGRLLDTRYRSVTRGHVSIQYSSPAACTIRARCTGGRWRRINR